MESEIIKTTVHSTVAVLACVIRVSADDAKVIDAMDDLPGTTAEKVTAELVDGKVGRAVKLSFADGCQNGYA